MNAILALLLLTSPPDSVLVDVQLSTTQEHILVEAVAGPDSTLQLPSGPVYQLLGLGIPPAPWISLASLQRDYPTVAFVWQRSEMRVVIIDRMEVLPASRSAKAEIVARTQMAFNMPVQSGPYAALAVDDSLHKLLEAGYSFRGRVAVAGRVDDARAGSWGASVIPNSHLFASYQGGTRSPPIVSARVSAGPFWISTTYTSHRPLDLSGLVRFGDVQFYAAKEYGVVTLNRPNQLAVSLATNWVQHRTAARVSVGPTYASPFQFPTTTLR